MTPTIRQATPADPARLAALEAEVSSHPWSEPQYAGSLAAGHRFYLLHAGGEIIAWAVVMQVLDEAELLNIATRKAHQRQGYAGVLLRHVLTTLADSGCRLLRLEVRTGNAGARRLYRRLGFYESGLRKAYYRAEQGREDAILMEVKPCPGA